MDTRATGLTDILAQIQALAQQAEQEREAILKEAEAERQRLIAEAEAQRTRMLREVEVERQRILAEAQVTGETMTRNAQVEADRIRREAEDERERILREAEAASQQTLAAARDEARAMVESAEWARQEIQRQAIALRRQTQATSERLRQLAEALDGFANETDRILHQMMLVELPTVSEAAPAPAATIAEQEPATVRMPVVPPPAAVPPAPEAAAPPEPAPPPVVEPTMPVTAAAPAPELPPTPAPQPEPVPAPEPTTLPAFEAPTLADEPVEVAFTGPTTVEVAVAASVPLPALHVLERILGELSTAPITLGPDNGTDEVRMLVTTEDPLGLVRRLQGLGRFDLSVRENNDGNVVVLVEAKRGEG